MYKNNKSPQCTRVNSMNIHTFTNIICLIFYIAYVRDGITNEWRKNGLLAKSSKKTSFSSLKFSRSVMSNSLQPHGLQHTRLPCPSPTPETLKFTSIESVMPSSRLILCHPLLLLPSIFSSIRTFSYKSVLFIRWPKYWSFSFSISPSNEYTGLISFGID